MELTADPAMQSILDLGEAQGNELAGENRPILSVLLTDDTDATREMMRRLLEDAGF